MAEEPRSLADLDEEERNLLTYRDVLKDYRDRTGAFGKFGLDKPPAPQPPTTPEQR